MLIATSVSPPRARDTYRFVKMFVAFIAAAFFAAWTLAGPIAYGNQSLREPLRFKEDGSFQLSIFEDLHFGENAWDSWVRINQGIAILVLRLTLLPRARSKTSTQW